MQKSLRNIPWLTPVALVCGLVFLYCALATWNKIDWCSGWAGQSAAMATRIRLESQDPLRTLEDREELLVAAEWHDIISAKYARVASHPWLQYPKAPLITDAEKSAAMQRTEAARAALAP